MPQVTCVIPVYNGGRYIEATLRSVAAQIRPPDRLIILDNCSTDDTKTVVERFAHLNPEWRQNERNVGLIGNANRALQFAEETDYLHLLMADDLIHPEFFRKTVAAMESTSGRSLCYTFHDIVDVQGNVIGPLTRSAPGTVRKLPSRSFVRRQSELNTVLLPGVLFKTNRQPAPREFPDMPQVADAVFLGAWAAHSDWVFEIPEYLSQNRHHPYSATSAQIRSVRATALDEWRAISIVLEMLNDDALQRWVHLQKVKCVYAARSRVKVQLMTKLDPAVAHEIERALREIVPLFHRLAGQTAVTLRDFIRKRKGQPSKAEELFEIYSHAKAAG